MIVCVVSRELSTPQFEGWNTESFRVMPPWEDVRKGRKGLRRTNGQDLSCSSKQGMKEGRDVCPYLFPVQLANLTRHTSWKRH